MAFAGPANASIWNWWPLPVWVVTAILGAAGIARPKLVLSPALWVAIFFAVTALLLFRAAVRLHLASLRPFPDALLEAPLVSASGSDKQVEISIHALFTNRATQQPVSLSPSLVIEPKGHVGVEHTVEPKAPLPKPIELVPGRRITWEGDLVFVWDRNHDGLLTPTVINGIEVGRSPINDHDKLRLDLRDRVSGKTASLYVPGSYESRGRPI